MATITQSITTESQSTTSNQYSLTRPLEEFCTLQPKDIIPKLAHVTQKYINDGCPKSQPGGLRTDRTKAFYLVLLGLHSKLDQWEMVHALQVHPMRLESMLEFAMTWYAYHFEWIPSTLQYRLDEERKAWRMSVEYEPVEAFGLKNEEEVSKPKGRKKSVVFAEDVKNSRPGRPTRTRAKDTSQVAGPVVGGGREGVRTSGRVRRAPARFLE
ncbi:hypothetical protein LTR56_001857 [Elasticomyces elasticus]|nr:hypothetical protein LTR56_001857 [Elasticomyces elasticus]KAK3668792.1 hypothetical protein LTR22_000272 [Elasticomyces elasticus]KAK4909016.1 hypothetical protein LTR49_022170 [Elasticomyces elasticus]KAK5757951.1 hypothetical protein LTS12_011990 [Elasticomyces elasticus]